MMFCSSKSTFFIDPWLQSSSSFSYFPFLLHKIFPRKKYEGKRRKLKREGEKYLDKKTSKFSILKSGYFLIFDFEIWVCSSFLFGWLFLVIMDLDSIECVSSSDGMDEDEIQHRILHPHHQQHHHHSEFSSLKPRSGGNNNHGVIGSTAIAPATSVHELLECPVCTNSMYPPIHQVCFIYT